MFSMINDEEGDPLAINLTNFSLFVGKSRNAKEVSRDIKSALDINDVSTMMWLAITAHNNLEKVKRKQKM